MKLKGSSSEVLLSGLLLIAIGSYLLASPTNEKAESSNSAKSVRAYAYLDGVLHLPNQKSVFVGDDSSAQIGRQFASVKGRLYLQDGGSVEVGGEKVTVYENCAVVGSRLFLENGLQTKLGSKQSQIDLKACRSL